MVGTGRYWEASLVSRAHSLLSCSCCICPPAPCCHHADPRVPLCTVCFYCCLYPELCEMTHQSPELPQRQGLTACGTEPALGPNQNKIVVLKFTANCSASLWVSLLVWLSSDVCHCSHVLLWRDFCFRWVAPVTFCPLGLLGLTDWVLGEKTLVSQGESPALCLLTALCWGFCCTLLQKQTFMWQITQDSLHVSRAPLTGSLHRFAGCSLKSFLEFC